MSNDLIEEYILAGRHLSDLNAMENVLAPPVPRVEPAVPDLLRNVVEALVAHDPISHAKEVDQALDSALHRLLAGGGVKTAISDEFSDAEKRRIYTLREELMELPRVNTMRNMEPLPALSNDYVAKSTELKEIFRVAAISIAKRVSDARYVNRTSTVSFERKCADALALRSEYQPALELCASRLARGVLLKKGVSILDVIKADAEAKSWEIFVGALIAECRWISTGPNPEEKITALEVVRSFDASEATSCAFTSNVHILRAYHECIQTLGYAS
jgi:hypothetical protein